MTDDSIMTAIQADAGPSLRRFLREQEDEIRKLTGELHRVKLDRLDGAKRIGDLLAEIERLSIEVANRAHFESELQKERDQLHTGLKKATAVALEQTQENERLRARACSLETALADSVNANWHNDEIAQRLG